MNEVDSLRFRQTIKNAMAIENVGLRDLAHLMGWNPGGLSNILNGKRRVPNREFVDKVATALDFEGPTLYFLSGYLPRFPDDWKCLIEMLTEMSHAQFDRVVDNVELLANDPIEKQLKKKRRTK